MYMLWTWHLMLYFRQWNSIRRFHCLCWSLSRHKLASVSDVWKSCHYPLKIIHSDILFSHFLTDAQGGTADHHQMDRGDSTSSRGLLKLLLMVFLLGCSGANADTISKLNYGVVFEGEGSVCAVYDFWAHTYEIPFPGLKLNKFVKDRGNRSLSCEALARHHLEACYIMKDALKNVNEVRRRYMSNLNLSLKLAKEVMPFELGNHTTTGSRSRSKRSLLPFIGDLSRSLFGTATEKEVKQMAKHIDLLEKRNAGLAEAFAQYSDDLSSFMTVANRRHNNLRQTIQDNHQAITALAQDMSEISNHLHHNLQFSVLLNREIYLAMTLQEGLQEFLHGIHGLLHHQLSPYMLPYKDIQSTINSINNKLKQSSSQLSVKDLSPKEIYSWKNFIWTYKHDSLFVTLKFPLVSPISHVHVYRIYALPVPFNDTSDHTTILKNLPEYLAITKDRHYYSFPPSKLWTDGILNAQQHNLPMHPIAEPSCAIALFFDNKHNIQSYCDFRVQINAIKPSIIHINEGRYLLSNVTNIYLRCPSGMRQEKGCKFCVFAVPCLCDITTDAVYFPPRLNHCEDDATKVTVVHPVNLAVLAHFHDEELLYHINGDSLFEAPLAAPTPKINIFHHNFSEFIAADNKDDLSLQRIANAIKNDKIVFQTLADPILDQLHFDDDGSLMSWTSLIAISDTLIIAVLCVVVAGLGLKVYTMSKVLAALQLANAVEGRPYIYLLPSTPATTTDSTLVIIKESDTTIMYIILVVAIVTLAGVVYKHLTNITKQATISVEITNGKHCVTIPLSKIPFCPKFYHICMNDNFIDLKIEGCLKTKFHWNKGNLHITNLVDKSELKMPDSMSLSPIKALKLHKILRDNYFVYLVGMHGQHAFHMKVCPLDCQRCIIDLDVVENPAQVEDNE